MISLVQKNVEVSPDCILAKVRTKIYNKGAQSIESESVFSKISNGLKKMLHRYGDEQSSRMVWTKASGYSRIEISFYCSSLEEQDQLLRFSHHEQFLRFAKAEVDLLTKILSKE